MFPASLDVTPDGLYAFAVNFNLHGDPVPSSVSVVYTLTQTEVARTTTCAMPHGSRVGPDGLLHYSACMMDDQLVETRGPRPRRLGRSGAAGLGDRYVAVEGRDGVGPGAVDVERRGAGGPGPRP